MEQAARLCDWHAVSLHRPFVSKTKADIVKRGAELSVPFERTWSCYRGGALHCGKCGTCVERREAFELAGVPDPTKYEG
jgi:7-cyano-7-deazaguanine synthase